MQAYLDNSATTRCSEGVRDIVVKVMMEDFGNPSSRHDKGMEAEKYLREARMDIAATLKADENSKYLVNGADIGDKTLGKMLNQKVESAYKILKSNTKLIIPDHICEAIEWLKK